MDLLQQLQSALGEAYVVERELGGGGMSRVFLAREHALGRTVVVKVLLPELAAGISAERFAREVRVAAALQHPNVVPLFRAGEAGGLPYYVMPYVRGESLRARLRRERRLPLADACSVLRDIARALAFAHEEGVIHRDVKPENVLLAGDAAVVTDFGIAKAVSASTQAMPGAEWSDATLTAIGSTIGTPAYMAPEQVAGDPRVDHRADLYAWGVVAYELLAGAHPFAHRVTAQQLLAAHLSETPVPVSQYAPEVPPAVAALVMRCLEKDAARRPQSARELLDALSAVATPTSGAAPSPRRLGRRHVAPAVAFLVLVAALVAYLAIGRRGAVTGDGAPAAPPSLAVLPFEDVGGDTADAYFGDGIADEISTALSKSGGLRVASRTSASAFTADRALDVREIGRRLGVSTVLEGRVRRAGDRMRLTVQLTSVADGLTLWSETYEREVKDVFRMQDEIARSIVGALRARLPGVGGPRPGRAIATPGTTDLEAYDLYLRGSYLVERRGSGVATAVEYFERAIAEDSTFARAHAGLSYALQLMPYFGGTPARAVERRATEAARHALALDPTLAEAQTALGLAHQHAYRWGEADEAFRSAIAADPGYAPAQYQYGRYLLYVGRIAEAEERLRQARAVDPLNGTTSVWLAYALSMLGRHEEALAEGRRARDIDSSLATVRTFLPLVALAAGRPDLARAVVGKVALPPAFNGQIAYVLAATGDHAGADAIVRELEAKPPDEWLVPTARTFAYLGLGDTARALTALETAARTEEITPTWTPLSDPMFDPLRRSARFAAVVRRFGLDERLLTSPSGGRPR